MVRVLFFHCLIFLQYNPITFSSSSEQNKYHSGHTSKYSVKQGRYANNCQIYAYNLLFRSADLRFLSTLYPESHLLVFFFWCFCFWKSIDLVSFCQNKTLYYIIPLINQLVAVSQTKMKARGNKTIKPEVSYIKNRKLILSKAGCPRRNEMAFEYYQTGTRLLEDAH